MSRHCENAVDGMRLKAVTRRSEPISFHGHSKQDGLVSHLRLRLACTGSHARKRASCRLDTWLPLIVPAFLGNPFYIFLARQFFTSVPFELDEAAKVDGAGYWKIFTHIMIPITKPLWITMALFAYQAAWNDYLQPLVYIYSQERWTLSMGMASFVGSFAGIGLQSGISTWQPTCCICFHP